MTAKRIFDFFFALVGLILLSPLLVAIAIWIEIDSSGPVFFQQTRIGRFGHPFKIYKFRTMVANAEILGKGKQVTAADDPRITKSGKLLRKYKLDELPQLLNVLKGEMSLVGPRPEVPKYVAFYTVKQRQVLDVLPGITDLGSLESIHLRNESELLAGLSNPEEVYIREIMPPKLESNIRYIKKASLALDLLIIFKTIGQLLGKSA